jgi:hypothetical protein
LTFVALPLTSSSSSSSSWSLSSLSDELLLSEELLEELLLDDSLLSSSFAKLLFGEATASSLAAVTPSTGLLFDPSAPVTAGVTASAEVVAAATLADEPAPSLTTFLSPVGLALCLPTDRLLFGELLPRLLKNFPIPRLAMGTFGLGDALLLVLVLPLTGVKDFSLPAESRLTGVTSFDDPSDVLVASPLCHGVATDDADDAASGGG